MGHMAADTPPDVTQDLTRLAAALNAAVPAKSATNLLIATWNVRAFGDLTKKWAAGPRDSPRRDWHAVACIAEVVSRFDVIALQEVRRNTAALRFLLELLGPGWRVIASDVTEGSAGNGERLAFLYDTDRLQPSGLVGEIVLPPLGAHPQRQFARTPYVAGFSRRHRIHFGFRARIVGQERDRTPPRGHRLRPLDARLGRPAPRLVPQPHGPRRLQPRPHRRSPL